MPSTPFSSAPKPEKIGHTPGHGGEYSGKNAPGVSFPVQPRPLRRQKWRWRALVETSDPSGNRGADPTKSFWHGGDRDEGAALAARELARQENEQAIIEQWY